MKRLFLSRRNLVTLLNKLDRPDSQCTLIKTDTVHPTYPCSDVIMVTAVEDEDYYIDRDAGYVHPEDIPK